VITLKTRSLEKMKHARQVVRDNIAALKSKRDHTIHKIKSPKVEEKACLMVLCHKSLVASAFKDDGASMAAIPLCTSMKDGFASFYKRAVALFPEQILDQFLVSSKRSMSCGMCVDMNPFVTDIMVRNWFWLKEAVSSLANGDEQKMGDFVWISEYYNKTSPKHGYRNLGYSGSAVSIAFQQGGELETRTKLLDAFHKQRLQNKKTILSFAHDKPSTLEWLQSKGAILCERGTVSPQKTTLYAWLLVIQPAKTEASSQLVFNASLFSPLQPEEAQVVTIASKQDTFEFFFSW